MKREIIRKTKTQETFKKALAALLEKNSILDISTKQVCQQAKRNRSTFYANYKDLNDLYQDLKKDLLEECYSSLSSAFFQEKTIVSFLSLVKGNKLLQTLLFQNEDTSFLNHLKHYESDQIKENMSFMKDNPYRDYIADYFISGSFAIIDRWVKNGCEKEIPSIAGLILGLTKNTNLDFIWNCH